MTKEDLNSAIGEAQEQYVAQARETPARPWRRWVAAAACVAVLAAGGALVWRFVLPSATPGGQPAEQADPRQSTEDRPVVYNELDGRMEEPPENSFAQFGSYITDKELSQLLPEGWPEEAPAYLWGSVGRYGWGEVAAVHLCFEAGNGQSGLISVRIRPEEAPHDDALVPLEDVPEYVPTLLEDEEVMLYLFRYRVPEGGEVLYAHFSRRGNEYSIQMNVTADQNEAASEDAFFMTAVCLCRYAQDVDYSKWVKLETSATRSYGG